MKYTYGKIIIIKSTNHKSYAKNRIPNGFSFLIKCTNFIYCPTLRYISSKYFSRNNIGTITLYSKKQILNFLNLSRKRFTDLKKNEILAAQGLISENLKRFPVSRIICSYSSHLIILKMHQIVKNQI